LSAIRAAASLPRVRTEVASAKLIFFASLVIYLALLPHRVDSLRPLRENVPAPTGDEPYYLQLMHNLLYYHGIELTESFDVRADYLRFYPEPLIQHRAVTVQPGHYSKHGLGLAVMGLPFYWIGDQFHVGAFTGVRVTVAAMIGLLAALLAANVYLLAAETVGGRWVPLVVWASLALTNPLLSYSFLIFPEIPAALLTLYAFRRIRLRQNSGLQLFAIALCIAFLPWLHARFLVISVALAAYLVATTKVWRRGWALPFVLPNVVSGALFLYYDQFLYGTFLPDYESHGAMTGLEGGIRGAVGLLIDQQWGLLTHAPFYLFAAVGLQYMATLALADRGGRGLLRFLREPGVGNDLFWLLAVTVPYFVVIATFSVWWGEWGPPARYQTAILGPLALPISLALARGRSAVVRVVYAALLVPALLVSAAFVYYPILMYNHPIGQSTLLLWLNQWLNGTDLTSALPSIVVFNGASYPLAVLWLLIYFLLAELTYAHVAMGNLADPACEGSPL